MCHFLCQFIIIVLSNYLFQTMAKEYDKYTFKPSVLLPGATKRNNAFPLDITNLFLSVEDAENYAKGSASTPDERKLYLQSYAGQIIGVKTGVIVKDNKETGIYDAYVIQGDGTIKKIGSGGDIDYVSYEEAYEELSAYDESQEIIGE